MIFALIALALVPTSAFAFTQWQTRRLERQHPPRGSFVEAGGSRLHYTVAEPAKAPHGTVLLLHGASGNQADVMLPLGPRLAAAGYRVFAFDRPGHGWSERPAGREHASPERQVALIRAALHTLGVDEAVVVGHSLAGALAVRFALADKRFTRGLVLIAPATHPWGGGLTWYYRWAARPFAGRLFAYLLAMPVGLALMRRAIEGVFTPQVPPPGYAERIGAALVLRPRNFIANAQDVFHLAEFIDEQAPRMGEIEAPTTIVTGDRDNVVYAHLHSLGSARDIPGATLVTLPGVGHAVQNVAPDKVARIILDVAERADWDIRANADSSSLTSR